MLNRSQIMTDAWNRYRICNRGRRLNRAALAFSLGKAWDDAKAALLSPVERRMVTLEAEIERLPTATRSPASNRSATAYRPN